MILHGESWDFDCTEGDFSALKYIFDKKKQQQQQKASFVFANITGGKVAVC